MVQKACGDCRLDKPRWEEWWTVWHKQSAAFILNFFYDLSDFWVSFFLFFCIQTKETKQRINQRKSPKQCCNWWDMADVPEDFDSQMFLQSSCSYVSSQLRVQAFCSSWLWCWCREASWTLGGSSLGCWDHPLSVSPLSGVVDYTCKNKQLINQLE